MTSPRSAAATPDTAGTFPALPAAAIGLICAVVAAAATVGADARWLAALGHAIVASRSIPDGVPYASAPSGAWPNVPVLAELVLHALVAAFGDHGLLLAQVIAVAGALSLLAVDMRRRGAKDGASALVLSLIAIGGASSFFVIRVQLFSLVLFPALVLLLRAEARSPSRRVWLIPLLIALWSNLHGAVLVGLAVAAAYLVLDRARSDPVTAAGVLVTSAIAVCATPGLERTPIYYIGVLRNEAAHRGEGLWAPLSLGATLDVTFGVTALVLVVMGLRRRQAVWEIVALAALAVLTVKTSRSGIWLLFFAGPLAASSLQLGFGRSRRWRAVAAAFATVAIFEVALGPHSADVSHSLIRETLARAGGTPVLADGRYSEQLAAAGAQVWMSNPLDAFARSDQQLYLDWLDGRANGRAAFAHAPRAVLVRRGGPTDLLTAASGQFVVAFEDANAILYVRPRG
jgi:hypothetical protein